MVWFAEIGQVIQAVRPPALPSVKIFTGPTRSMSSPVPVTSPCA